MEKEANKKANDILGQISKGNFDTITTDDKYYDSGEALKQEQDENSKTRTNKK
ncbi:MAG: hypothetical protein MRQ09_00575 [Candidatus Midichloria sp.]|nr:hypothetical protein [Candidatus Midichloria sp.]